MDDGWDWFSVRVSDSMLTLVLHGTMVSVDTFYLIWDIV
jgi:hypothetical protein